ncbi:MAG: prepilin-type N-terminal cleavage/methylation domain-containing protein, partial [Candidatus Saccharimonadales bacterium]
MVLSNINTKQKERGFTIVELLVVIVVIGILAAITIVSYSGITARANTQANKSNANSVIQAAQVVYANTGAYPVTSATAATVLTNLNASDAK